MAVGPARRATSPKLMNSSLISTLPPLPIANIVVDTFFHGGVIMWPLLALSLVTLGIVIERLFWWVTARRGRETDRLNRLYHALSHGDEEEAGRLAAGSSDARIRVIAHGLEHSETDIEIGMQVQAADELKGANRFLNILDTAITLAPLLGLLGTVTGIMRSFHFVGGDQALAAAKVSGGIGEALIATAFGLGIAITTLIPYNTFGSYADDLRQQLDNVVRNVHLLTEKARLRARSDIFSPGATKE
jgi:biopolymer transport protein ExbB